MHRDGPIEALCWAVIDARCEQFPRRFRPFGTAAAPLKTKPLLASEVRAARSLDRMELVPQRRSWRKSVKMNIMDMEIQTCLYVILLWLRRSVADGRIAKDSYAVVFFCRAENST